MLETTLTPSQLSEKAQKLREEAYRADTLAGALRSMERARYWLEAAKFNLNEAARLAPLTSEEIGAVLAHGVNAENAYESLRDDIVTHAKEDMRKTAVENFVEMMTGFRVSAASPVRFTRGIGR